MILNNDMKNISEKKFQNVAAHIQSLQNPIPQRTASHLCIKIGIVIPRPHIHIYKLQFPPQYGIVEPICIVMYQQ